MGRIKKIYTEEYLGVKPDFENFQILENNNTEENEYSEHIYFVSDGKYVKIGVTNNVEKRLQSLQSGNPKKLNLLFVIKGNKDLESYLHSKFKKYKKLNEWFDILSILNKEDIINYKTLHVNKYNSNFVKVFNTSKNRKKISSLSSKSKDLFLWLLYSIEESKDYVKIDKERYMEESKTSLNTFKKSVEELIKESIISSTIYRDIYWINPLFFFNGSRYEKYKDHVVEK